MKGDVKDWILRILKLKMLSGSWRPDVDALELFQLEFPTPLYIHFLL